MEDVKIKTGFGGLRKSVRLEYWFGRIYSEDDELTWARECSACADSYSRFAVADPQFDHLRICGLPEGTHGMLRAVAGEEVGGKLKLTLDRAQEPSIVVDRSRGEKLVVNLNIDFPRVPCYCEWRFVPPERNTR